MLTTLLNLDTQVFLFINHLPHNYIVDLFFGLLTLAGSEGIIWLVIAIYLFLKNSKKLTYLGSGRMSVMLILTFVIGWLITTTTEILLKNFFKRPRPQFDLAQAFITFDFVHSYSFPSGHAMIAFTMAYILGELGKFGKFGKWGLYLLAVLISFSRIYLGKHYPADVLAGAILGMLIGFLSLRITPYFWRMLNQKFPRIFV